MSRMKRWPRAAAVLLLAALAVGARGDDVLTTADVVRFLRAGISERTIISELQTRGFGEELDAAREATLRQAGATETLVVAVRRVAPGAVPPKGGDTQGAVAAAPGGASGGTSRGSAFPASSGRRGGLTFGATARSVRVPVSVLDKRGEPILGLRSEDFRVTEDGRTQPVTFFSGERKPLRIALALDLSGSMQSKMREVSDALQYFINLLEPADEIMVITFNDVVTIDQDFTSDRDLLDRLFDRLQPSGGTALYDAAVEAIRRVAPLPAESKAVVLVTDGVDMGSSARYDDLLEIARQSEVPVFSLGIDGQDGMRDLFRQLGGMGGRGPGGGWPRRPGGRGWPGGGGGGGWPGGGGGGFPGGGGRGGMGGVREFDARPLMDLADETGGRAEIIKANDGDAIRSGRLKQAVESIAVTLRHRYLVGYEPEGSKHGWRKIKVDVERPQVKVQARKGYYAEG